MLLLLLLTLLVLRWAGSESRGLSNRTFVWNATQEE